MKKQLTLWLLALLSSAALSAQGSPFTPHSPTPAAKASAGRLLRPAEATYYRLDSPAKLDAELRAGAATLVLPRPDGSLATFRVATFDLFGPELRAAFPYHLAARGYNPDAPGETVFLNWTRGGLHASVHGHPTGNYYLDPLRQGDNRTHQLYYGRDLPAQAAALACAAGQAARPTPAAGGKRVENCELLEYGIVVATTGEYYDFFETGTNDQTVVDAIGVTLTRINQITIRDLGVTLMMVNPVTNGDVALLFDNPANDPYPNPNNTSALIDDNQAATDAALGGAAYDLGHLFSTAGGGLAQIASVCNSGSQARATSGTGSPVGESFNLLVAHELGHQFGANHTFSGADASCDAANFNAGTAFEPASGSTIMSYAGICGNDNVQLDRDDYYHGFSIQQIAAYLEAGNGNTCATVSSLTNDQPTVSAGPDYVIPVGTPFVLTATANDTDGDPLLYTWEQLDNGPRRTGEPTGAEATGPLFRSLPPTTDNQRYLPNLADLTAGTSFFESLPLVARTLTFLVTVRDINTTFGCTAQDEMTITVVDPQPGSQFGLTSPNGGESFPAGSTQTITWNVADTDGGQIDCNNVDLMLSTDGGMTYPDLIATVPNNGSYAWTVPNLTVTQARVMLRCSDNIFFDISDGDFSITQEDFALNATGEATVCNAANTSTAATFTLTSLQGYSGTINYSVSGLPGSVTATFSPTTTTLASGATETVQVTFSGTSGLAAGDYPITLVADDGINPKMTTLTLSVNEPLTAPVLNTPPDGGFGDPASTTFTWNAVPGATAYNFQHTQGANAVVGGPYSLFLNDIDGTSVALNLSQFVNDGETHFWRVVPVDGECDSPAVGPPSSPHQITYGMAPPSGTSLSSTDSPQTICAGEAAGAYSVLYSAGDLTGTVTFSLVSAPAGVTVTIAPMTAQPGGTVSVTPTGAENLAAGSYDIVIRGTSNANVTEDLTLTLNVDDNGITITEPEDGSSEELAQGPAGENTVTFNWTGVAGADRYLVPYLVIRGGQTVITGTTGVQYGSQTGAIPLTFDMVFSTNVQDGDVIEYTMRAEDSSTDAVIATSCTRSFTFVAAGSLPVEWLAFAAHANGKSVRLDWTVAQDGLQRDYTVERRGDAPAAPWRAAGSDLPARPGSGTFNYDFTDDDLPAPGRYYYRIRQRDRDGRATYSPIRAVTFDAALSGLAAFPNPTTGLLQLRGGAAAADYALLDYLGRRLRTGTLTDSGTATLDLGELPAGVYQVAVGPTVIRVVRR